MSKNISNKKIGIHIIITLVLMFGIGFIPPFSALTVTGMRILGILVGTIYGADLCHLGINGDYESRWAIYRQYSRGC